MAQVYYCDPQSAGINMQSPQSDLTPWTLTLGMTTVQKHDGPIFPLNRAFVLKKISTQKSLWIFAVVKKERTWPLWFKKVMIMLLEKTYQQFRVDLFRHKNWSGGTCGDSGDLSPYTFGWRRRLNFRAFFHLPKICQTFPHTAHWPILGWNVS